MKTIKEVLSENIWRYRKIVRKMTQGELAERAEIPFSTFQAIEDKKTWPEYANIQAIADALGIPETELFFDQDLKHREDPLRELLGILPTLNETRLKMILEAARAARDLSSIKRGTEGNEQKKAKE